MFQLQILNDVIVRNQEEDYWLKRLKTYWTTSLSHVTYTCLCIMTSAFFSFWSQIPWISWLGTTWSVDRDENFTTSPAGGGGDVTTGASKYKKHSQQGVMPSCVKLLSFGDFLSDSCLVTPSWFSLLPNFLTGVSLFTGTPGAFLRGTLSSPDWTWKIQTERAEGLHSSFADIMSLVIWLKSGQSQQRRREEKQHCTGLCKCSTFQKCEKQTCNSA